MDQINLLLLLSFSMLVGSFISGTIPMAFRLSDSKSRLLALMGSGILVGTALAIIIPEGIDSIYAQPLQPIIALNNHMSNVSASSNEAKQTTTSQQTIAYQEPVETWTIGVSLVAGFVLMLLIDQFSLYQSGVGDEQQHSSLVNSSSSHHSTNYTLANQEDDTINGENVVDDDEDDDDDEDVEVYNRATTSYINEKERNIDMDQHRISIRGLGVLDQDGDNNNATTAIANNHQSSLRGNKLRSDGHVRIPHEVIVNNTKVTPTLGLVIHASADGIALGAAATTSHRDVEMIIFLAIMLHKAPAAFSLVVFLLHRGLKHSTIRRHLLAFSLSAPLAALLTYFGLSQSGKEALRRNNATGIAMLFSAGTFLYVATVHVLPELVHNKRLTPKELLFVVGGAFLPILLAQTV